MLLYFSVGGFCSFKEVQDLFLTAYLGTRLKNTKYEKNFYIDKTNRVMKSAIIFGANASGKTNIILGLERLKDIIFNGINLPKDFNEKNLNYDSNTIKFEIGILDKKENIYDYSIEFQKDKLIYEKLECNDKVIYEFKGDILSSKKLPKEVNKIFSIISTETILKKLRDFQVEEITDFISSLEWIKIRRNRGINYESKDTPNPISENIKLRLEDKKEEVLQIIKLLDHTIEDLKFEKLGTVNNEIVYDIYFLREKSKNKFYLGNESEGIRKVINLMLDLLEVYEGKTIVIDELDSSISTISLIKLFNNFINVDNNIKGQLIVTSHNLFLFDNNIFEPQQIYIVNKKEDLSSELYSLAEFKIRSEKENLYHDFLKGKYGGING
ncbi:AAA family ATPase [Fusobacterium mortiferum]|uniref:ATP-binding protein n=2 Tax=Fusobacterium mortiferum TaxID=850 RepID=A0ABS2G4L2_FUSMR|nr:ATP-binding protein [Fusobacterium mortiferum]MBM6875502.1 ATP-binding protein [Fusobacterium mortiferum]